jgi:hypothetical protein
LKEISINWENWERFKISPDYFIADDEKSYREYEDTENGNERT